MEKRRSIMANIIYVCVFPVLILGILLTWLSYHTVDDTIQRTVKDRLSGTAHMLYSTIMWKNYGELKYADGELKAGNVLLNVQEMVEQAKRDTGNETTIFWENKRIATTVQEGKKRLIGTAASEEVVKTVLEDKEEYFSSSVDIAGESYYGYYVPIKDSLGTPVGMVFAGCPVSSTAQQVDKISKQVMAVSVLVIVLTLLACFFFMKRIARCFIELKTYLKSITDGDFSVDMNPMVMKRQDELHEMGDNLVRLKTNLQDAIFTDPVTGLLNAKAFSYCVDRWVIKLKKREMPFFTFAEVDIDGFDKINNTYGHECGDMVLNEMGRLIAGICDDRVIRGRIHGDQFYIASRQTVRELNSDMKALQALVREDAIIQLDVTIHFTVTIAIKEYDGSMGIERNMREIDNMLRDAKSEEKRDTIVKERKEKGKEE